MYAYLPTTLLYSWTIYDKENILQEKEKLGRVQKKARTITNDLIRRRVKCKIPS